MALKREGNYLVKPSASFANIFDAVPSATAAIIKEKVIIIAYYKLKKGTLNSLFL